MMRLRAFLPPLLLGLVASGFNLEPRLAVVKEGAKGSYFGFAVEQHQIVNRCVCTVVVASKQLPISSSSCDDNDDDDCGYMHLFRDSLESSLLVGAPLDYDPSSGEQDGVLWKCPLTPRKDDCRLVAK